MMPKPDKDTDKRPDKNKIISLMNIDTNVLNKILENWIQSYPKKKKKGANIMIMWDLFEEFKDGSILQNQSI